jgi:hypothetical protein
MLDVILLSVCMPNVFMLSVAMPCPSNPCKPFKPSLILSSEEQSNSSGAPFRRYPLGQAQAMSANIEPGWRGLRGTNALAYLTSLSVTMKKHSQSFFVTYDWAE